MTKKVSASKAKVQFSTLVAEVAYGGERVIIEKRGRPLAALVSLSELELLELGQTMSPRPRGALALLGAWKDVGDSEIDALVSHIYAQRGKEKGRPVELEA